MTLYLISIGLGDEKDITLKGLEIIQKCDIVYLESFTSKLNCKIEDLEQLYKKKIKIANREICENKAEIILNEAKNKDIAFLVIGDIFSATTHVNFLISAKKLGIEIKLIHNAAILTAIGEIGLDLYKFGRTISIPLENKNVISPVRFLRENLKAGLHTLILLDMIPSENKFLSISEACDYLIRNRISEKTLAVGCTAIGTDTAEIKAGILGLLRDWKFSNFPQCIAIPGKLHFIEEEMLRYYML